VITDEIEHAANDLGIKLEYVNGLPIWEALPVYRHQKKTLDIQISIVKHAESSGCACIPIADTTILFPDGSYKRPDVAVYCEEPSDQDKAITLLPRAVIEIISKGYEKKDTDVSLPFYLAQDISDVVIFDPSTNRVSHYHDGQIDNYDSPVELTFACGCRVNI
jgi:Uma2 family endonuclease